MLVPGPCRRGRHVDQHSTMILSPHGVLLPLLAQPDRLLLISLFHGHKTVRALFPSSDDGPQVLLSSVLPPPQ